MRVTSIHAQPVLGARYPAAAAAVSAGKDVQASSDAVTLSGATEATKAAEKSAAAGPVPVASDPVPAQIAVLEREGAPPVAIPRALGAVPGKVRLDAFMKVRDFDLLVARDGKVTSQTVPVHSAPGHNSTLVAALIVDGSNPPQPVLKDGDMRFARVLAGDAYEKMGFVAGRWDKAGVDGSGIGIDEIAEEVGGHALENGLRPLGEQLLPSMPHESTEADQYFVAVIKLDSSVTGDGGGMEIPGQMGPHVMTLEEGFQAMNEGRVGDSARCRVMYNRALDSIGYIRELGVWVHDVPALAARHSTLGLGPVWDPRHLKPAPRSSEEHEEKGDPAPPPAEKVDNGLLLSCERIPVSDGVTMLDAVTSHAVGDRPVRKPMKNQILQVDYGRAKVITYYVDPERGPMVHAGDVERPVMAVKGLALDQERTYKKENTELVRQDLDEARLRLGEDPDAQVAAAFHGQPTRLATASTASSGQSTLYYHFYANEVPPEDGFVPLHEFIQACRADAQADSAAEATCELLTENLQWLPTLRMTVEQARQLLPQKE
ncbi:MAG: hypothetical protein HY319_31850 [Armatimonadetes bacterium]|nr:hypothetical protein [Armatimonadota bacterium]